MSGQGRPSRYNRSFNGMVGALIVTVLFVVSFVVWRGLFRTDVDDTPVAVDWQESVKLAEQADLRVVHPRALPDGWTATSTDLSAGDDPRWALGVLTAEGDFVGIRQQDSSVDDLVDLYVDEEAEQGDDAQVTSEVADTWQTFSDDGGDHGFAAEIGDEAVLVYGSAPVDEIEAYLGTLTR
ncbi:DUF4245 domain-containing protein [Nocardioides sp. Soil774]|uniref:DUF4245 domain-containing protein n=1 Tax=Nocardioides sp. Soil774 TaxID=1736408 RepID=UPI000AD1DEED|nr:DUF4245 domain-containing protein [Nocardioides sp. Soil774]